MRKTISLKDCVYLVAKSIGATHIKKHWPNKWTAYKVSSDEIMICFILFTENISSGELFSIDNWRRGKLVSGAECLDVCDGEKKAVGGE